MYFQLCKPNFTLHPRHETVPLEILNAEEAFKLTRDVVARESGWFAETLTLLRFTTVNNANLISFIILTVT